MTHTDLENKTALVTGASSGIGRQQAKALAAAGAQVVLLGRRLDALEETANDITSAGGKAHCVAADLAVLADIENISAKVRKAADRPIDILCNTAGVNHRQAPDDVSIDTWQHTLDLNLGAPFFLARTLVEDMRRHQWGRIINVASLQTQRAFPNGMAYGASKGGIAQLTRAMAEAWSSDGITANAIGPGFFPTELTEPVFQQSALADDLAKRTAIGRNGALNDLDGITVFLASDASAYITGQVIYVDGGFTAL